MSDTLDSLRHQIHSANQLRSVVSTTKTLAASSIGQYERAVRALADYRETIELGLSVGLGRGAAVRQRGFGERRERPPPLSAVVFGSDQGLVGRFNERVAEHTISTLEAEPGPVRVWVVGERVVGRLLDAGLEPETHFAVPSSTHGIPGLVAELLLVTGALVDGDREAEVHLFFNRPEPGNVCAPVRQRLLPLDEGWRRTLSERPWPTCRLPEVIGGRLATLRALIREYLFVQVYCAVAESLMSEHASRLAAMQRAEKNIEELLEVLMLDYHRMRQNGIDEELFDVVSGFRALVDTQRE